MKYISGLYTDVGIKKKTNQDSLLLMQAEIGSNEAVFALVCDGMGGLQKGEVASADVVLHFSTWFKQTFPTIINNGVLDSEKMKKQWKEIINLRDDAISGYGAHNGIRLGTTITGLLIFANQYYAINVGDSRVYLLADQLYQITHDHTLVQEKIDNGQITYQQSLTDPQRSVLLQCIGTGDYLRPDFFSGQVVPNQTYLLCCDGFRHVISPAELYNSFRPDKMTSQKVIESILRSTTELLKKRRETDNISAIVIRTA